MTVITKPFVDKKPKKDENLSLDSENHGDVERGDEIFLVTARSRRMSSATTIVLFLSAFGVLCMGIIAGVDIYRAYGRSQMQRMRFHGFCGVPYDSSIIDNNAMIYMNNKWREEAEGINSAILKPMEQDLSRFFNQTPDSYFFKEEIELGLGEDESYSKINVPDFRDGRNGRFLHDFKKNQSCIIDIDAGRCFVMPLDRETVLPPKSMYDLINKMWSGYYNIDTDVIRTNMRVILPAVTDYSDIAQKILDECQTKKIYMLEKYVGGVFKRNAELSNSGKFAEFCGLKIREFDIVNINAIDE